MPRPRFHLFNLLSDFVGNLLATEIFVNVGVLDAGFLFVGLTLIKSGGRCFFNDCGRCAQISQMLVYFADGEVCDGVEIVCSVPPLCEISESCFVKIAGAGNRDILLPGRERKAWSCEGADLCLRLPF